MALFLDICGHAIVAIMALFMIFDKMARPIIAIFFKLLRSFLAFYTKLWPKKESDRNYGRFLCIFRSFWLENGPSRGGTSHVSSELILTFLESGKQGEWD